MILTNGNQPVFSGLLLVFGLLLIILAWMIGGYRWHIGPLDVPIQVFSVMALLPIALYDGCKRTDSLWVRRGFYLFYPAHLLVLYVIRCL